MIRETVYEVRHSTFTEIRTVRTIEEKEKETFQKIKIATPTEAIGKRRWIGVGLIGQDPLIFTGYRMTSRWGVQAGATTRNFRGMVALQFRF